MSTIGFICPKCKTQLQGDLSTAGQKVTCPKCSQIMIVPSGTAPQKSNSWWKRLFGKMFRRRRTANAASAESINTRQVIEDAGGQGPGSLDYLDWTLAMAHWTKSKSSGDLSQARESIRKAIACSPCAKFWSALGQTEEMACMYTGAADAAIEAWQKNPDDPSLQQWLRGHEDLLYQLAELCKPQCSDFTPKRAERLYSIIVHFTKDKKRRAFAYFQRGVIRSEALNRRQDGVRDLQEALKNDPENGTIRKYLNRMK